MRLQMQNEQVNFVRHGVRRCLCVWYRFAVLTGCPALWLLDCVIAATGAQTYEVARKESWELHKKMWNLYAPNDQAHL